MKLYITVILTALMLSLTACHSESEPVVPGTGDDITLTFRMSTGVASRSDNLGHSETDSEYPEVEDRIDPADLAVFIYVKKAGEADDTEKLLLNTKAKNDSVEFYIDGAPGEYIVNLNVSRTYFNELIKTHVSPNGTENLAFRLVLFANCTSPGTNGKYDRPWTQLTTEETATYKDLIETLQERKWCYSMGWLYTQPAVPYENNLITDIYTGARAIPMFGTNSFVTTQQRLYNSSPENPLYLGSVDMLRAVAKVRVVDNIQDKDATGYPKVVGAEIVGTKDQAYQLPYDALTYQNGTQVHNANIVNSDVDNLVEPYVLGRLPSNWTMTPANQRTGSTFAGFVPEQVIYYIQSTVEKTAPLLNIYVAMFKQLDGTDFVKQFTVEMAKYSAFGERIYRNHIYTLAVTEISNTSLNCVVDLVPYRGCTLDPWFGL